MNAPTPADGLLAALATARLTRLLTTDLLGEWAVVAPARAWAQRREPADAFGPEARGPRHRAVTGLECPFCAGMWVGVAVLAARAAAAARGPRALGAWRFAAAALAMNYIVGHVSSRID